MVELSERVAALGGLRTQDQKHTALEYTADGTVLMTARFLG